MLMNIFVIGFAVILLVAGVYHFVNPAFYDPIMPGWFPKRLANAAGGIAEILIGAAILYPPTRVYGTYAAALLMVVFLPLHVWDLTKSRPAIGNHTTAAFRLVLQFVFIGGLFWAARMMQLAENGE